MSPTAPSNPRFFTFRLPIHRNNKQSQIPTSFTNTGHSLPSMRWHTSQTQSTHFPVWQVTHITNTGHSLPSRMRNTSQTQSTHFPVWQVTHHHKHSPLTSQYKVTRITNSLLTPQYDRQHTSQTQSTHFPVWQVTHITNTIHSLPSMTGDTHHKHSPLTPQYEVTHHHRNSPLTPLYDWHIKKKSRVSHLKCTCVETALQTAFRTNSIIFSLHIWYILNEGRLRQLFRILRTVTHWRCEQSIVP